MYKKNPKALLNSKSCGKVTDTLVIAVFYIWFVSIKKDKAGSYIHLEHFG
jgi:hypothetical protein